MSKITNEQIIKMDFYDFCGSASCFMTKSDKIKWWCDAIKNSKTKKNEPRRTKNI